MLSQEKPYKKHMPSFFFWIGIVLIGMLVCTTISVKNYMSSLNRVTVASSVKNEIRRTVESDAALKFSKTDQLAIPENCRVIQKFVTAGSNFHSGEPLLQYDRDDLIEKQFENRLKKRELTKNTPQDDIELQLMKIKERKLEEEEQLLADFIENDGMVYAPCDGQVVEFVASGQRNRLIYAIPESGYYIEWRVKPQEYASFSKISAIVQGQEIVLDNVTISYHEPENKYVFRSADFTCDFQKPVIYGEYANVQMLYISEEYESVIPKSSIRLDSDGFSYVFLVRERDTVFGKESYVEKVGVTVIEKDEQNAAVLAELENFVVYSSRPLIDLEAVKVIS